MKRLILSGLVALGLVWAQGFYVGGHVGLSGVSFTVPQANQGGNLNLLMGGIHAGFGFTGFLGALVEIRVGVDFKSLSPAGLVPGISIDTLTNLAPIDLGTPGLVFLPYVGLGGSFSPLFATSHTTLGLKYPIPGAPLTPFLEVQPGYAFFGPYPGFAYHLKVGANYGF